MGPPSSGVSLAALKLPFFSVDGAQQDPATCFAKDVSATDKKLIISNWPAYIDPIHKPGSTVSVFEQQTGISVHYTDDVNDNAEFYAKVKNQLGVVPVDQARHDRADRLDGRPDDRARLDPAARPRQDARTSPRT